MSFFISWMKTRIVIASIIFVFPIYASRSSGEITSPVDGICQADIVKTSGHQCQEFEVKTEDGYILSLQRITNGSATTSELRRIPVLIQHGLFMDGMSWMLNSPEESLPLILAGEGYDVWIGNIRGTKWSRRHERLSSSSKEYWNWSWDELKEYDFPTTVEFVSAQTGQPKIHYIGHSLGTLVAIASFSEGKMVKKFLSTVLLSPIGYLDHMTSPLIAFAAKAFVGDAMKLMGMAEFNPKIMIKWMLPICGILKINCIKELLNLITGKNCCLSESTMKVFATYEPQSTSIKTLVHLAQMSRSGVVAKYDYGDPLHNLLHYGSLSPPMYNLGNIPTNISLFLNYGGKDSLADTFDIARLLDNLKNHDPDKINVKSIKDYAHADFIMGKSTKKDIYNEIITFINNQSTN